MESFLFPLPWRLPPLLHIERIPLRKHEEALARVDAHVHRAVVFEYQSSLPISVYSPGLSQNQDKLPPLPDVNGRLGDDSGRGRYESIRGSSFPFLPLQCWLFYGHGI